MTKNPRNHREWTNEEIEQAPQGYRAAQEAYRNDKAAREQKRRDEDDLKRFTEAFVAAGGSAEAAPAAFKALRNEQAAAVAAREALRGDTAAEEHTRRAAMRSV